VQSIRHVRADLAAVVRRAASGNRTIVTVGGRAVAQIGPLEAADARFVDIADLVARGLVMPPRRHGTYTHPEPVPVWAGTRVEQAVRSARP
jgi:antitoxin (DNA-binding transcriptional repressor) of toxin-antitoxin stability system